MTRKTSKHLFIAAVVLPGRWSGRLVRRGCGGRHTLAVLSTSVGSIEASGSPIQAADDPKVISDWNAVAFDTIVVDAGKANAEAFMWFAFEQAAVYNAVVGITGEYELYKWNRRGDHGASPQAAAAVAAHDVLLEYFRGVAGRLDTARQHHSPRSPRAFEEQGYYCERGPTAHQAPQALRPLRPITFVPPGLVWRWCDRPTPPAFARSSTLGCRSCALLLDSPIHFCRVRSSIDLRTYTNDFIDVKRGFITITVRDTRPETSTALSSPGAPSRSSAQALRDWPPATSGLSASAAVLAVGMTRPTPGSRPGIPSKVGLLRVTAISCRHRGNPDLSRCRLLPPYSHSAIPGTLVAHHVGEQPPAP